MVAGFFSCVLKRAAGSKANIWHEDKRPHFRQPDVTHPSLGNKPKTRQWFANNTQSIHFSIAFLKKVLKMDQNHS